MSEFLAIDTVGQVLIDGLDVLPYRAQGLFELNHLAVETGLCL